MDAGGSRLRALVRDVLSRELISVPMSFQSHGRNLLSCAALVRSYFDCTSRLVRTGGQVLESSGSLLSCGVAETLDSGDLGFLDALKLVALGCIDRHGDCLSSRDLLKVVGSKAGLLVVDVNSFERESIASCFDRQHEFMAGDRS